MLNRILDDSRRALVSELRQKLGEVRVALVRAEAGEELQKALGRATLQLDELLLLVVVGEFNAGKSSVLNTLLGERVLEEGPTPTTSRIQLIKYGAERTRTPAGGDFEQLTLPVLFVTSADRPFTETERTFLETIRDWGKKVVVAVNKVDILEQPEDVRKVVEFVKDKLRELLGLRPEVFAVSARQAWRAKAAGLLPDPQSSGLGALEAWLTRTLDRAERLRVKLESPLGVAERVLDTAAAAVRARLGTLQEDEAALKEVEGLLLAQLQEQTRDFRLRLSEAEKPLVELERRGSAFLEETLRPSRVPALLDAERTEGHSGRRSWQGSRRRSTSARKASPTRSRPASRGCFRRWRRA
jgi:GTP-binding protein EngB required for normal cell division